MLKFDTTPQAAADSRTFASDEARTTVEVPSAEATSVAQKRVTPQELSRAIAAVESQSQKQANTISLGDAVEQLDLNMTPEILWRQIEMQRAETLAVQKRRRNLWSRVFNKRNLLATAGAFSVLLNLALIRNQLNTTDSPTIQSPAAAASITDNSENSQTQVSLAGLSDGGKIPVTLGTVRELGLKHEASNLFGGTVFPIPEAGNRQWNLIKQGNEFFVQGARNMSDDRVIYSHPLSDKDEPVLLPVAAFADAKNPYKVVKKGEVTETGSAWQVEAVRIGDGYLLPMTSKATR